MDEAANCDEIPKQFGEVRRNRRVQNSEMISKVSQVSEYDWFVNVDWSSRDYRYRGSVVEPPFLQSKRGQGKNDRWEPMPPAINTLTVCTPPFHEPLGNSRATFWYDARKPPAQNYGLAASVRSHLRLSFSFPLSHFLFLSVSFWRIEKSPSRNSNCLSTLSTNTKVDLAGNWSIYPLCY